jgi:hypothetical protein
MEAAYVPVVMRAYMCCVKGFVMGTWNGRSPRSSSKEEMESAG